MSIVRFTYNPKTLRFEKAKFNWGNLIFNVLGVVLTGILFFTGLIYLQNEFFETELETNLRNENNALTKHKKIVEAEISQATFALFDLTNNDKALHKRILLTDEAAEEKTVSYTKESLAASTSAFDQLVNELTTKSKKALSKAALASYEFSKLYWPVKGDVEELTHYPTLPPLPNFKVDALVCGYGNQVNPFNKLLYKHKGVDLSAERGSAVLASGSGKILLVSRSVMPTGLGNHIVIDHGNGYTTTYAHLQDIKVFQGQKIQQGAIIGTVGISGGVIAPHLHFEIAKHDKNCNPIQFLIKQTDVATFIALVASNKSTKQALD